MLRGSCNVEFENFDPETQYIEIVLNDLKTFSTIHIWDEGIEFRDLEHILHKILD